MQSPAACAKMEANRREFGTEVKNKRAGAASPRTLPHRHYPTEEIMKALSGRSATIIAFINLATAIIGLAAALMILAAAL